MPRRKNPTASRVAGRGAVRVPSYRLHKASGQAYVVIHGRAHYLGKHGTRASREGYARVIAEWAAAGEAAPAAVGGVLTIVELLAAYLTHARTYYVKNGQATSEMSWILDSMRPLRRLYGRTPAAEFGPLALKAVREEMIATGKTPRRPNGLSRGVINRRIARIKRMFRWATENELLPPSVYHGLASVAGLPKGRCEAKDPPPIGPVPEAHVDAIRPHVARQVWAMIQLQRFTGMRPGEVVAMRGCDLDTEGALWMYVPWSHKTEHHGAKRRIELGPRVQAALAPFLRANVSEHLFRPIDAEAERHGDMRRRRKTRVQPSQQDRRKRRPKRTPQECYTVASYRRVIERGCAKAEVPAWHPHQLRHTFATIVRREFGLDAARAVLGHRSPIVTEVYAELDQMKAAEVLRKLG
jgi:integrase